MTSRNSTPWFFLKGILLGSVCLRWFMHSITLLWLSFDYRVLADLVGGWWQVTVTGMRWSCPVPDFRGCSSEVSSNNLSARESGWFLIHSWLYTYLYVSLMRIIYIYDMCVLYYTLYYSVCLNLYCELCMMHLYSLTVWLYGALVCLQETPKKLPENRASTTSTKISAKRGARLQLPRRSGFFGALPFLRFAGTVAYHALLLGQ